MKTCEYCGWTKKFGENNKCHKCDRYMSKKALDNQCRDQLEAIYLQKIGLIDVDWQQEIIEAVKLVYFTEETLIVIEPKFDDIIVIPQRNQDELIDWYNFEYDTEYERYDEPVYLKVSTNLGLVKVEEISLKDVEEMIEEA